ncbi:GNAT family N-acetyltransferase [Clostridium sp.]|uniref:GNAT family N-acetyltransferase n=1 Tax=Clostridium sp. TaxID=1506 RepID=UPI003F374E41
MKFEIKDTITKEDEDTILKGLLEYNLARIEDKNPRDLGIYLKDETGRKVSGLIGDTHGNWLFIKFLWVSEELRGKSIGSKILKQAEKIAKERGCKYSFLDTFSFQAPEFYKKHGYNEVFVLENYPITGKRHYFTKTI